MIDHLKITNIQNRAFMLGSSLALLLIIANQFTTAGSLVLSILLCFFWFISGQFKNTTLICKTTPATTIALLLFLLLFVSISYSLAPYKAAFSTLAKYRELLFPLVLIPFFSGSKQYQKAELFLIISLIATLLFSYATFFHLLPFKLADHFLKSRITHSIFIGFLGFIALHKIHHSFNRTHWVIILILSIFNLFVICDGRTGQLSFLLMCGLFFLQSFNLRIAVIAATVIIISFSILFIFTPLGERFIEGINESIGFYQHDPSTDSTSMGIRLHFWQSAINMIQHNPWLGSGVGGVPFLFSELFPEQTQAMSNPHNEYLLLGTQLGLPGLLLFIFLIYSLFKQSLELPQVQAWLFQGLLLSLCISCLFNSSILDNTEGHWYMTLIAVYSSQLIKFRHA